MVLILIIIASCENGFDELNTSKTNPTQIDPVYSLNRAIINSGPGASSLVYEIGIVQQVISPFSGLLTGSNFNQDNRQSTEDLWQRYYRDVIKDAKDVIIQTEDDPDRQNLMNMAKIIKSYVFMVLTDTYGSIPYSEGGEGYSNQIFFPVYESQQTIYPQIIAELQQATESLNASAKIETSEILYGGNIDQWKKFGYSLLLRAGMRLSEVDAAQAQSVVNNAFNGGVITSNSDNAYINHDANYTNPIGNNLNSTEGDNYFLTKPFVDHLKSTNDPRLLSISVRYIGAQSGSDMVSEKASYLAEDQIGMPLGHDIGSIVQAVASDGLASFYDYSQADRRRIVSRETPWFIVTAGQTNLLLAEARFRGWISAGTAADYYHEGIKASIDQMAAYGENTSVPEADRDAYLNDNTLSSGNELQQINTQYWISSFLNGPEAWANFRRSGYPELTPNPYPGGEVEWINRLTYPNSEISVNTENVQAAIEQQGPDNLATKVWWHK